MSRIMTAIPKTILYYHPASIWSTVALLGLKEKGYGPDELELKVVDLNACENLTPAYVRINPNGTVPALAVPLENILDPAVPNKFRAFTDTKSVLEFLDKSRSVVSSTHTTSSAPAPVLSPATVALSAISNSIIALVHTVPVSFLSIAASTPEGLAVKAQSPRAGHLRGRLALLNKYVVKPNNDIIKKLVETRHMDNGFFVGVLNAGGKAESELSSQEKQDRDAFFRKSVEAWTAVKNVLTQLETNLVGLYALGDQVSLADLHVGGWLTRIFSVSGAPQPSRQNHDAEYPGFAIVEKVVRGHTGDATFTLGPKVRKFWEVLKDRESWKQVYGDRM